MDGSSSPDAWELLKCCWTEKCTPQVNVMPAVPQAPSHAPVTNLPDPNEAVDIAAGEDAEVAEVDGFAGGEFEEKFVQQIEELEGDGFDALGTLSDEAEIGAGADVAG